MGQKNKVTEFNHYTAMKARHLLSPNKAEGQFTKNR